MAPNLCDDTHDCGVSTGDQFLKTLLPQILSSQAYRSGKTAVFVVWDEDSHYPQHRHRAVGDPRHDHLNGREPLWIAPSH